MNKQNEWWDFQVWSEFSKMIYDQTLTHENIMKKGNSFLIPEVYVIKNNGTKLSASGEGIGHKCVFMEKDEKCYIVPEKYIKKLPFNPAPGKTMECHLKPSDTKVYNFVWDVIALKLEGKKTKSFKEFIDTFNPKETTNPKLYTWLKLQAIGSVTKSCKFRMCGASRSGKNATDKIIKYITEDIWITKKPSPAALYQAMCFNQKIVLDELANVKKADMQDIFDTVLEISDENPDLTKTTLNASHKLASTDISTKSLILTYNRVQDLQPKQVFFDDKVPGPAAFEMRIPAFLLPENAFTEKFNKLTPKEGREIMLENKPKLIEAARNFLHFTKNPTDELHGYDTSKIKLKSNTQWVNIQGIVESCDRYSKSQTEFDEWIQFMNDMMLDYKIMVNKHRNELKEEDTIFSQYEEVDLRA